jgi:hypothetical protein
MARLSIKSGVCAGDRAVGLWVAPPYGDFHAAVERDQIPIDPAAVEPMELSPTPSPTPAPVSNPTIAGSPLASHLNNNQSAQILLSAGLPAQSLQAFVGAGLEPRRLLGLLQNGWEPDRILDMVGHFAQPEADGGRVDRYADFLESENIEDRRGEPPERGKRYPWKTYWDPDYRDRPARGLERQLGRDRIPLPSQTLRE